MSHITEILRNAEAAQAILEKTQEAIEHALSQISSRGEVAWYCGHGTETFAKLTQALAALTGQTVEEIEAEYEPARCHDPRQLRVEEPGRNYADTCRPYDKPWTDLDEHERECAANAERTLFENYGIEIVLDEGEDS